VNNDSGYVPSGMASEKDTTGGAKKKVGDPFAKFDNYDPTKKATGNTSGGGVVPFNNNNISHISNHSNNTNNADSLFNSGRKNPTSMMNNNRTNEEKPKNDYQPSFGNRLQEKSKEKKEDFWSDFLNEDKPKETKPQPVVKKPEVQEYKPTPNKMTFEDVADLEDELILD
jgi:hypothetical protein